MTRLSILPFVAAFLAIMVTSSSEVKAQAFPEGTHMLSAGHGAVTFMGALKRSFDPYNDLTYKSLGPLYFKYEYAVADNIGIGLNFAYAENDFTYSYASTDSEGNARTFSETTSRSTYSVLARFNFHFGDSDRFDPYLGLGLGYRDANWEISSDSPDGTSGISFNSLVPFGFEMTIGARYFFTDNIGLYGEVGGAKSVFQGGVTARF